MTHSLPMEPASCCMTDSSTAQTSAQSVDEPFFSSSIEKPDHVTQYPFFHGTRPSLEKKGDGIINVCNNISVFCAHEGEMGANECVQVLTWRN